MLVREWDRGPLSSRRGLAACPCAAAALAANVALFAYWLYKIVAFKRNPITGVLYCELSEFRTIVREHCDDKDKYFLVDRIPETPEELGFEPDSSVVWAACPSRGHLVSCEGIVGCRAAMARGGGTRTGRSR